MYRRSIALIGLFSALAFGDTGFAPPALTVSSDDGTYRRRGIQEIEFSTGTIVVVSGNKAVVSSSGTIVGGTGDITAVNAGYGLLGGGITGSVTLHLTPDSTSYIQNRNTLQSNTTFYVSSGAVHSGFRLPYVSDTRILFSSASLVTGSSDLTWSHAYKSLHVNYSDDTSGIPLAVGYSAQNAQPDLLGYFFGGNDTGFPSTDRSARISVKNYGLNTSIVDIAVSTATGQYLPGHDGASIMSNGVYDDLAIGVQAYPSGTRAIGLRLSASGGTYQGVTVSSSAVAGSALDVYPAANSTFQRWLTTNGSVAGSLTTSGALALSGVSPGLAINATGYVRLYDADSSNYIGLKSSNTVAGNVTFTLPAADGVSGQLLSTNGNGTLIWASGSTPVWAVNANSSTSFSADSTHTFITSSNASIQTINLPTAVGITGKVYVIKRLGAISGTTIDPDGTETIDGASTYSLASQYDSVMIISDGANWQIMAKK